MKTLLVLLLVICAACKQAESPQSGDTAGSTGTTATVPASPTEGSPATDTVAMQPQPTGTATPNTNTNPPADAAPSPTGEIADGQSVYRARCVTCHGADGKKPAGTVTLVSQATQAKAESELASRFRAVDEHRAVALNENEVTAVVSYIKALR